MAISTAVSDERISRIVGYQIIKGDFSNVTPNLPQRVAILAEANEANQATLDLTPKEITSAQQAGTLYGYGSPIYQIMRILRPVNGGGIGGIQTVVYPQAVGAAAVAAAREITPTGTATASGKHTVVINGRTSIDGQSFDFNVVSGDTPAIICDKITAVVNAVLASPVTAVDGTTKVTLTSKWKGLTSEGLNITVNTNSNSLGVTYAVTSSATGAVTPSITDALNLFAENWNTIVINSYGEPVFDALEAFNGKPDATTPTGRYASIVMKPFIALAGETSETISDYTDLSANRTEEVTNAICPAPGSDGFKFEAAANVALLFAVKSNNEPHLDVNAMSYPDMPVPTDRVIGDMSNYETRDILVKDGVSTVKLVDNKYQIQDFITTYRPAGETPPQFRYCRNLMLDFNVRFGYYLLEQINVVDHTIANDADIVAVGNVIKPKQWKQIIDKYAEDLGKRALIADVPLCKNQ